MYGPRLLVGAGTDRRRAPNRRECRSALLCYSRNEVSPDSESAVCSLQSRIESPIASLTADCLLLTAHCSSPTAYCSLPTADYLYASGSHCSTSRANRSVAAASSRSPISGDPFLGSTPVAPCGKNAFQWRGPLNSIPSRQGE